MFKKTALFSRDGFPNEDADDDEEEEKVTVVMGPTWRFSDSWKW